MFGYRLNIQAEEDLTRIFEYGMGRFGYFQALKYYDEFYGCFSKIAKKPYMFSDASHLRMGYRSCVCGVDTIYYKINSDVIEIMAIIGKQDF